MIQVASGLQPDLLSAGLTSQSKQAAQILVQLTTEDPGLLKQTQASSPKDLVPHFHCRHHSGLASMFNKNCSQ